MTPDWVERYPPLAPLLDYAWAQYHTKRGDPQAYFDQAASIAHAPQPPARQLDERADPALPPAQVKGHGMQLGMVGLGRMGANMARRLGARVSHVGLISPGGFPRRRFGERPIRSYKGA